MIEGLKPYPKMKDSGVPWLGRVPEHWESMRCRYLLRAIDTRSPEGSELHLSMSQRLGLVPSSLVEHRSLFAESYANGKLCEVGDVVLNRLKAHLGVFAVARHAGVVSADYTVFRPINRTGVKYFEQTLRSPCCRQELRIRAKGIVEGFWRLYTDDFYDIRLPVPPLTERVAIIRFLAHADRQIRQLIRSKQKLLTLLEEQKQAIIHRAVTRGLDPNVDFKPSGIEMLGDVPAHWDTPLNQRVFRERIRPHEGRTEVQLSLSQRDGLIATEDMKERSLRTSSFDNWKVVYPGDLVLNRFKAHLGVFFASTLRGIVSFHYGVFAARQPLVAKYFELLYHTRPYRAIYAGRSNGMTVGLQNLSNQNFYNVRTLVPPIPEQEAIVSCVTSATETLVRAQRDAQREIDLLKEFRTRLISDVVTGKLDVREAAARLPEESIDGEDPFDDTDPDGEEDDDSSVESVPEDGDGG